MVNTLYLTTLLSLLGCTNVAKKISVNKNPYNYEIKDWSYNEKSVNIKVFKHAIPFDEISILGIHYMRSGRDDIKKIFGDFIFKSAGPHHPEKMNFICFEGTDGSIFKINNWQMLGDVKLQVAKNNNVRDLVVYNEKIECNKSDFNKNQLATTRNIKLGMTKKEVKKILNEPSYEEKEFLSFEYHTNDKKTVAECRPDGFDVRTSFILKFENEKLIYFEIEHGEQC